MFVVKFVLFVLKGPKINEKEAKNGPLKSKEHNQPTHKASQILNVVNFLFKKCVFLF